MLLTKSTFDMISAFEMYCSMLSFGLQHCKAVHQIVCSTGYDWNAPTVIENYKYFAGWHHFCIFIYTTFWCTITKSTWPLSITGWSNNSKHPYKCNFLKCYYGVVIVVVMLKNLKYIKQWFQEAYIFVTGNRCLAWQQNSMIKTVSGIFKLPCCIFLPYCYCVASSLSFL